MALMALKQELTQYLSQNFMDGTLNRQYEELQKLRDISNLRFIVEVLTLFCSETEQMLEEIDRHTKPFMNISTVESYVQTIRGSSTTIGSQNVTLACDEFCRASERKNIAECHKALLQLIREFYHTKDVFKKIIELERKIIYLATKTQA